MKRIRSFILSFSGLLAATLLLVAQPAWSKTINQSGDRVEGVPNWGRVTDTLYRGAQPSIAGFKALQQMGVAIIVNFRDERNEVGEEKSAVESLGLKYVSIPWSGADEPSSSQVVQFLDLVRANPQAKIFVHCKRGADRTGVMIAAYRIATEHKTVDQAVAEMHQYHYAHFFLPQLQRYVNSLPQLLRGSPQFSAYAPTPTAPSGLVSAAATAAALVPAAAH